MQKIQILGSQDKKAKPIFDHHHPKIIKITFDFSDFLSTKN